MSKNEWTEEAAYDEHISPLMTKIIAICKEHRIPMVAQFVIGHDAEQGAFRCTTSLRSSTMGREDGGNTERMHKAAMGAEHSVLAITVMGGRS